MENFLTEHFTIAVKEFAGSVKVALTTNEYREVEEKLEKLKEQGIQMGEKMKAESKSMYKKKKKKKKRRMRQMKTKK